MGATVHPITAAEWDGLKAQYAGCCAYCGRPEPNPTMDHVVPLIKGGDHTVDNIVPACGSCNASKCNDEVTGWLRRKRLDERAFLERHVAIRSELVTRFPTPAP